MYLLLNSLIENQPINRVMYLCRAQSINVDCEKTYISVANRLDYIGRVSK